MKNEITIVLIEDDQGIVEILTPPLEKEGFNIRHYHSAEDYISDSSRPAHGLYLIDWKLPGIQGIEVVKLIRRNDKHSPLFMMTAYARPEQIIHGLEAGADDYILKPFNNLELMLRLKNARTKATHVRESLIDLGVKLLPEAHCILVNGISVSLTAREYLIFEYLYNRKNQEVHRSELIALFPKNEEIQNRNIDVHIFSIRKKLANKKHKLDIMSVRGKGYQLTSYEAAG